ncbi:MAG: hypothetical protein AAB425_06240, partial [Bdellovibrionota bacterium]
MLYVGKDSTEASVTFKASVWISKQSNGAAPTPAVIRAKIDRQVAHLFGPMAADTYTAVPKGDHTIQTGAVQAVGNGQYKVEYQYVGTAVIKNGPTATYTVLLPKNPDTVYEESVQASGGTQCTDSQHSEEEYFWYFWSPKKWGCKLQNGVHYQTISAKITRFVNTERTYPEYDRMVSQGVIRQTVLWGMDDPGKSWNPMESDDLNAVNYRIVKSDLKGMGYTARLLSASEIKGVVKGATSKLPIVEEFTRTTPRAKIVVRMVFGDSAVPGWNTGFHWYLKDAIETNAVVIYAGHSGLGKYVNLSVIETEQNFKISFPKNQYQLFFFNGCSSYPYYNSMYFAPKMTDADPKGTRNLDILTNGLATFFTAIPGSVSGVLQAVDYWAAGKATFTYQSLISDIDSDNLLGVNGDDDNPTEPPK